MKTMDFAARTFPSRIAELGFSLALPRDWIEHALPDETPDFDDPARLVALAAVTAPHAAIVLAVAARPAYAEGTLSDWGRWLLERESASVRAMGEGRLGELPALVAEATKDSEVGTLLLRTAFAEDGARLINVTLTAPELLADAVLSVWQAALESFALAAPRGPTVPVYPPAGAPAPPPAAAGAMAAYALADDAASFDPEHPVNARLREQGVGFVPRIVELDAPGRCARLACAALFAELQVPFGWHPIDDSRRLRLLDPSGAAQISLDLLPAEGRAMSAMLDALETEARAAYPAPEFARLGEGRIVALGVRNIHDGAQALEQYHMLVEGPDPERVLRARVTSIPERSVSAVNLGEQLLLGVRFLQTAGAAPVEAESEPDRPAVTDPESGPAAWWTAAQALEAAGRIEEAVALVERECNLLGALISQAELWARTMHRRLAAGDREGARQAWRNSMELARAYAASATSGGEGAALSRERDAFLSSLGPEPASDPQ